MMTSFDWMIVFQVAVNICGFDWVGKMNIA